MAARALNSLKNRLLALVLLGLAPAMMAVAIMAVAVMAKDASHGVALSNVLSLVRMISEIHDRELDSSQAVLSALFADQDFDPGRCDSHFRHVLVHSKEFIALMLMTPDGQELCSRGRGGADLRWLGKLPAVRQSLETNEVAIGPYLQQGEGGLAVPISLPLLDQAGQVAAIVVAVRSFPLAAGRLTTSILPAGAHLLILDQSGMVRHSEGGRARAGLPAPVEAVARAVREGSSGVLTEKGSDGNLRIFAYDRIGKQNDSLFAVISVPETVVLGPLRTFFWLVVAVLILVALAMAVILIVAGRRLVFAPTSRLVDVIERVRAGDRQARVGDVRAYGELNAISGAFDELLDEVDQREARFRALFDQSPDAILVHNLEGRFVDANTASMRLTGFRKERLIGMGIKDLIPKADMARLSETWAALQPGRPVTVTGELLREDGVVLPVETYLASLGHAEGRQVVVVIRDVSAQIRARRALEIARDQAEQASRAKSDFLASMSHELRTPLNAVIGFGETMKMEMFGPLLPKYREYAHDIVDSGTHLLDLITDILDLAKIEAGRMELVEEPVDLGPVVEGAVKLLRGRAEIGKVELNVRMPAGVTKVMGDPRRLKQVLINLLSNGVKFTPAGGCVTVTVSMPKGQGVVLTVEDTGIGMAAEDIPRALEPFGQVGRAVTRPTEGTGLGLALVRGIVEMHGGTIAIDSMPGQGTIVTVRLPAGRVIAT